MEVKFNGNELKSGVYKIYNKLKDRTYYGSTKKFLQRYEDHIRLLKNNEHFNKYLQNDFNNTGVEHFIFEVLEVTTLEEQFVMEQIYLDQYHDNQTKCYNSKKQAIQEPRSVFSYTPEETLKIMSNNTKAMWADPVMREIILQAGKKATSTIEYKENLRKSQKSAWENNDERRNETSIKFKKMWEEDREKTYERMHGKVAISKRIETLKTSAVKKHKKLMSNKKFETDYVYEPPLTKHNIKNSKRFKTFIGANLLSPDGILYKNITNIQSFSKKHNLSSNKVGSLIKLELLYYKGWIKYFDLEENCDLISKNKNHIKKNANLSEMELLQLHKIIGEHKFVDVVFHSFKSPSGEGYNNISNVTQFANKFNLDRRSLADLTTGRIKSYKGWTLYITPDDNLGN